MNFLIGLLFIALGIVIIRFRYQIYNFTGDWDWAVKYLGGNGTVVAMVFIGMFLIWVWAAYPFWVIDLGSKNTITVSELNPAWSQ
jgi:hypothetical protein